MPWRDHLVQNLAERVERLETAVPFDHSSADPDLIRADIREQEQVYRNAKFRFEQIQSQNDILQNALALYDEIPGFMRALLEAPSGEREQVPDFQTQHEIVQMHEPLIRQVSRDVQQIQDTKVPDSAAFAHMVHSMPTRLARLQEKRRDQVEDMQMLSEQSFELLHSRWNRIRMLNEAFVLAQEQLTDHIRSMRDIHRS